MANTKRTLRWVGLLAGAVALLIVGGALRRGLSEPANGGAPTAVRSGAGAVAPPASRTDDEQENGDEGGAQGDGPLRIRVLGEGAPIEGAKVAVNYEVDGTTDGQVRVELHPPTEVAYHVHARAPGWAPQTVAIHVKTNSDTR